MSRNVRYSSLMILWTMSFVSGCGRSPSLPPVPRPPDFVYTAKEWIEITNGLSESNYTAKYRGKIIEVTGLVTSYETDLTSEIYYGIGTEKPRVDFCCSSKEPDPWKRALPGQTVTFRGTAVVPKGRLVHAVIVGAIGEPPAPLTAQQFGREILVQAESPEKLKSKYYVVTGQIAKYLVRNDYRTEFTFQDNSTDLAVKCTVEIPAGETQNRIKAGATIKFLATDISITDGSVNIGSAVRLEILP